MGVPEGTAAEPAAEDSSAETEQSETVSPAEGARSEALLFSIRHFTLQNGKKDQWCPNCRPKTLFRLDNQFDT